jgi:hypothetical protein
VLRAVDNAASSVAVRADGQTWRRVLAHVGDLGPYLEALSGHAEGDVAGVCPTCGPVT